MKLVTLVRFDEEERWLAADALAGLIPATAKDELYDKLARFRNSCRERGGAGEGPQSAAYTIEYLHDLDEELLALLAELEPQQDPSWWRDRGAPGPSDSVEGLAIQRRRQLERLRQLRGLLQEAIIQVSHREALA
jgi:hypothetical protein